MKHTHTPGPWFADGSFVGSVAIDRFFVKCNAKDLPNGNDEAEANARLIAAAPELLAALETIVHWGKAAQIGNTSRSKQWTMFETARAAVARATGGQA